MENKEILYQADARYYLLARDAANDFARTYWAQPRKIRKWDAEAKTFEMVGGAGRIYRVTLAATKDAQRVWQITVAD